MQEYAELIKELGKFGAIETGVALISSLFLFNWMSYKLTKNNIEAGDMTVKDYRNKLENTPLKPRIIQPFFYPGLKLALKRYESKSSLSG